MKERAWLVVVSAGALALSACGGSGEGSVIVTREGRPTEQFAAAHLACTVTQTDPPSEFVVLDCEHGNPDADDGVELSATFNHAIGDLPAGTTLEQGVDFEITRIGGGTGGSSLWGAGGSGFWAGDLMITLEERTDAGQAAVFEGTTETTDAVESSGLIPINVRFDLVAATLP